MHMMNVHECIEPLFEIAFLFRFCVLHTEMLSIIKGSINKCAVQLPVQSLGLAGINRKKSNVFRYHFEYYVLNKFKVLIVQIQSNC